MPRVKRLHWELDTEVFAVLCFISQTKEAVETAYSVGRKIADDFDNAIIFFRDFGKNVIKKTRVSPDAFIQMALQLAYFKVNFSTVTGKSTQDQGSFGLTYESSILRLFMDGRTETVRSLSADSCAFVRGMLDRNITVSDYCRKI